MQKKLISYLSSMRVHKLVTSLIFGILFSYFIFAQILTFPIFTIYQDPEIPYLFSSLSIIKGHPIAYVDHPGTPFQLLGSLLLLFTYPVIALNYESFFVFHILNPSYFLVIGRFVLLVFSCIVLFFLAKETSKTAHWTNPLKLFTVLAAFYAFHPDSFQTISLWSHHSINLPGGTLVLLISWIIFKKDQPIKLQELIIVGLITGSLTTFQLYFIPWVFGALISFCIYSWMSTKKISKLFQTIAVIGVSFMLGFLIMTLPILSRISEFLSFVLDLTTHTGLYGNGEAGFITPLAYLGNFLIYSKTLPLLFLAFSVLLIFIVFQIFFRKSNISNGIKSFSIGITVQILLSLAIILKHPNQYYFLSIAATIPILILIAYELLEPEKPHEANSKYKTRISVKINPKDVVVFVGFLIVLTAFSLNIQISIEVIHERITWISNEQSSIDYFSTSYSKHLSKDPSELEIIWTYETNSPCYSRWYGNIYGDFAFTSEIAEICKGNFQLDLWSNRVFTEQGYIAPEKFPWDIIVIKDWMIEAEVFPEVLDNGKTIDLEESDYSVIIRD